MQFSIYFNRRVSVMILSKSFFISSGDRFTLKRDCAPKERPSVFFYIRPFAEGDRINFAPSEDSNQPFRAGNCQNSFASLLKRSLVYRKEFANSFLLE